MNLSIEFKLDFKVSSKATARKQNNGRAKSILWGKYNKYNKKKITVEKFRNEGFFERFL